MSFAALIKRHKVEAGFTLIELLVVVIIIAILAAVAVPVYIGIQNNAKKSSIQSDVATTKTNVAAVFAEDQPYATSLVENSHSPQAETVKVYGSDGTTELAAGATTQTFTVVGSGGAGLGNYTVTYTAADGQTVTSAAGTATTTTGTATTTTATNNSGTSTLESDDTNLPYWLNYDSSSRLSYISTAYAYNGSRSMSVPCTNSHKDWEAIYKPTGLTVGKTYTLTAWVYIPASSGTTTVYMAGMGSSSNTVTTTVKATWTKLTTTFSPSSSVGQADFQVGSTLGLGVAPTVYVDDVTIAQS